MKNSLTPCYTSKRLSSIIVQFLVLIQILSLSTAQQQLPQIPQIPQITTPCTANMISSFTPCMNYITGSSANGASPTSQCCGAFRSIMSDSMDCVCLLITASVPLPVSVSRNLALSLPRVCSGVSVPVQCKAGGSPLPAPGPALFGPPPPPSAFSPQASASAVSAPAADTSDLTPALTPTAETTAADSPSDLTGRIRPVLTPSSSNAISSATSSPALLLMLVGLLIWAV